MRREGMKPKTGTSRCRWWLQRVGWQAKTWTMRTCFAWPICTQSCPLSKASFSKAFPRLYWCWSRAPSGTAGTRKTPTRCQSDSDWRWPLSLSQSARTRAAAWTRPGRWHRRSGTISGPITGSTGSAPSVAPFCRPSRTKPSSAWRGTSGRSLPQKLWRWTAWTPRRPRYDRFLRRYIIRYFYLFIYFFLLFLSSRLRGNFQSSEFLWIRKFLVGEIDVILCKDLGSRNFSSFVFSRRKKG